MRSSPFCKQCNNYRQGMSTCKLNLSQLKFKQTGKYRKSCTGFEGNFAEAVKSAEEPAHERSNDDLKNTRQDFLSALDCYYEFRTNHPEYTSIYDFFLWCRKKLNL